MGYSPQVAKSQTQLSDFTSLHFTSLHLHGSMETVFQKLSAVESKVRLLWRTPYQDEMIWDHVHYQGFLKRVCYLPVHGKASVTYEKNVK